VTADLCLSFGRMLRQTILLPHWGDVFAAMLQADDDNMLASLESWIVGVSLLLHRMPAVSLPGNPRVESIRSCPLPGSGQNAGFIADNETQAILAGDTCSYVGCALDVLKQHAFGLLCNRCAADPCPRLLQCMAIAVLSASAAQMVQQAQLYAAYTWSTWCASL
jgi:hypothetical protein